MAGGGCRAGAWRGLGSNARGRAGSFWVTLPWDSRRGLRSGRWQSGLQETWASKPPMSLKLSEPGEALQGPHRNSISKMKQRGQHHSRRPCFQALSGKEKINKEITVSFHSVSCWGLPSHHPPPNPCSRPGCRGKNSSRKPVGSEDNVHQCHFSQRGLHSARAPGPPLTSCADLFRH